MRKLKASYACVAITALVVAVMLLLPQSRQEAPIAVQTAQVRLGSVERILALSGRVRYETEYAALAPAAGLVAEVYVSPASACWLDSRFSAWTVPCRRLAISARLSQQDVSALSAVPQEWSQTAQSLREGGAPIALRFRRQSFPHSPFAHRWMVWCSR